MALCSDAGNYQNHPPAPLRSVPHFVHSCAAGINKIFPKKPFGNYLYQQVKDAPKDESFPQYWSVQAQVVSRNSLIDSLLAEYQQLISNGSLLIDPKLAFGTDSIEGAFIKLWQLTDYKSLFQMQKHTVGRYSERAGYYVFNALDLLQATTEGCKTVNDINGKQIATGVFNKDAVAVVLPALGISMPQTAPALQAPGSISPRSAMFQPAASTGSTVGAVQQQPSAASQM